MASAAAEDDAKTQTVKSSGMSQSSDAAIPLDLPSTDGEAELAMGGTIGVGGMGKVRAALQLPLDRQVAVKHVTPENDTPEAADALLREAVVMAMIEHPNVVPIYGITRDELGRPVLVMKRIAGRPWREAIAVPMTPETLEPHLEVLSQICRALAYAHSKGIVHRDLKLDNVMIGEFGEVYLLDWGLAVSLREEHNGRIPLAREAVAGAGTPMHMAPEMLAADGLVDERTDVYLLGAMLHELLTGRGRHASRSLDETLREALLSPPHEYPDEVPNELAAICNRATSRWPDERYASVEAFREALARFLERRSSRELADEANIRLERIERATALEGAELHRLAIEARFGFQQALRAWPDNPVARRGLQRVLERLIDHELAQGNGDAAEALLAELPIIPPGYRERLAAARARRREEERSVGELTRLRSEFNMGVNAPARARALIAAAVLIASFVLAVDALAEQEVLPKGYPIIATGCIFSTLVAFLVRQRLRRRVNAAVRGTMDSIVILAFASSAIIVAAMYLGVEYHQSLGLISLQAATVATMLARLVLRDAWMSAVVLLASAVAIFRFPQFDGELFALGFVLAALPYARAMRRRARITSAGVAMVITEPPPPPSSRRGRRRVAK